MIYKSKNHNSRGDADIRFLILHYTEVDAAETHRLFMDEKDVSAHYVVTLNGDLIQYVDEEHRAWHAGKSYWDGVADINAHSIGIEIENGGHANGLPDYGDAQISAVISLSSGIIDRHYIKPFHVLGHSDVAPTRKQDPGEHFPWKKLADSGIGLWPDDKPSAPFDMREGLIKYGYDPHLDTDVLMTAFKRHFHPESLIRADDVETQRRLSCLINQKSAIT